MVPTRGYGQFCPVAVASEVLAERWTPLVLRELLCGSHRFNDIHRGVPLMSTSLLSQRLRQLQDFGLVEKQNTADGRGQGYALTEAGEALRPIIMGIGVWGLQFMKSTFHAHNLDPSLLLWDMRRWIRPAHLPEGRAVIEFDILNTRGVRQHYWLVKETAETDLDLCLFDPGYEVDLVVRSDIATLARVWLGEIAVETAVRDRQVELEGQPALRMSFYDWIGLSPFAHLRERPVQDVVETFQAPRRG